VRSHEDGWGEAFDNLDRTLEAAPLDRVELPHALSPAHADHLVAPIQRVLHHLLSELP
jgi:hypothetical protein